MIQSYYTTNQGEIIQDTDFAHVEWIHLSDPTDDEINRVVNHFGFPKDYLSSVLDPDEVSRHENLELDESKSSSLAMFLYPLKITGNPNDSEYVTRPLAVIMTSKTVITAAVNTPDFISKMIENKPDFPISSTNQERFLLDIAWHISSNYIIYLKDINAKIEKLEDTITKTSKNRQLFVLMSLQKSLVYFSTAIESNHPIFKRLKDIERFNTDKNILSFLHDVVIENQQAEAMIRQSSKLLKQISTVFSSVISNNLNNIMKVLTSITIVLTIPNIVGALWGMNVSLPLEDTPGVFWIICLIIIIICAVTVWMLRKKDYF
ncbi:magnesium transporter CorA family protein [Carnobacterium pleistocenium]|uniref:magnesium transporter CorA family protein n=1 Tax=Carnobacterium pleistocenium TaxID=181073 RepID=UPI000556C4C2|nr:magnesium transporter CorA family protein [Carnobacterium pleistocenium]